MKVYFDLDNFRYFFKTLDDKPSDSESLEGTTILRLLKENFEIHLNFKPEDEDLGEFLEEQLGEFTEGVANETKLTHSFDALGERPIDENNVEFELNSVYLINDPIVESLKTKKEVVVASVGEENKLFNKLTIGSDFHDQRIIDETDFNSWEKLEQYVLPFSTLLLNDRYIFKEGSIGSEWKIFNKNLGVILKQFYKNKTSNARLVFICEIDPFNKFKKIYFSSGYFKRIYANIEDTIKEENENIPIPEIVLAFVPVTKYRDDLKQIKNKHDRCIITNYFRIGGYDSFTKFYPNGEIKGDNTDVDFYSHGKKKYENISRKKVVEFSKVIEDLRKYYPQYFHINFDLADDEKIINL